MAFMLVLLARRLFASRILPALVGVVVIIDGSMFAQARIGMNDSYVALFIVAGWYFIVAAHHPRLSRTADLVIAGVLLGLGAASKWAAFYTLAGVLVAALAVTAYAYLKGRPGAGGPLDLLAGRGRNAALLFGAFAVIPVAIYWASYLHWFGGPTAPYGWDLIELTKQMYWYHSSLTSPHPAASPWWSWPVVLKPVYWYYGQSEGANNAYIYDAGNVVLFWGALVATAWCGLAAIRSRSVTVGFAVFALLVQYVGLDPDQPRAVLLSLLHRAPVLPPGTLHRPRRALGVRPLASRRRLPRTRRRGVRVLLPVRVRTARAGAAGRDVLRPSDLAVRLPVLSGVRLPAERAERHPAPRDRRTARRRRAGGCGRRGSVRGRAVAARHARGRAGAARAGSGRGSAPDSPG